MSNRIELLTPVGRLVQGSLYEPQTTDAEGRPLTTKTGTNAGQPRVEYYFALAIEKGSEVHWSETDWGAKIYNAGLLGFPNGQTQSPQFAWKVQDGDNTVPNRVGRRNCDREGYPHHWVLNFSSGFAPSIHTEDGMKQIPEKDAVKLGDYIQVFGSVSDNGAIQQPGVFLNHQMVAFSGHGERIVLGADPKAVGFGKAPKPAGVKSTPQGAGFNPASGVPSMTLPMPTHNTYSAPVMPPVVPYPGILTPPVPQATPVRVMLPSAKGATYEQMITLGWTDELLIQHGHMQP
jgi:hypothetical protein